MLKQLNEKVLVLTYIEEKISFKMSWSWKNMGPTVLLFLLFSMDFCTSESSMNQNSDEGHAYDQNLAWTYVCNSGTCLKEKMERNTTRVSLDTCSMLCATPLLWPKPSSVHVMGNGSEAFNKHHIGIRINATEGIKADLKLAVAIFMSNLPILKTPWLVDVDITHLEVKQILQIHLNVKSDENKLGINTNESYSLSVKKVNGDSVAVITADTYFGARHGLETLNQLIWYDTDLQILKILHNVDIFDTPAFPYRGLMVDTAGNFFPIEQLRKVVDGMAASKLNVLHLHLTDSVSFPIILPSLSKFAKYGAYSSQMVYTPEDIKGLVEYARIRGIKVILEVTAPSHVSEGWNFGDEKLVMCNENNVFNGHLNPDNKNVQGILKGIYQDLLALGSDSEIFHMGVDEIDLKCWTGTNSTKDNTDIRDFWADFINNMLTTLKAANRGNVPENIVLWSSTLTEEKLQKLDFQKHIVIQHRLGEFYRYLDTNHKIIFSEMNHWYLNCGFGPWKVLMKKGICDPYTSWQKFYKYRPWAAYPNHISQVLGGETCLWSEQVDVHSLETRIWPRAAVAAERLWRDPTTFNDYDVYTRLARHRERLLKRGIKSAAMWPRWCYQNPGKC